MSMKLKLCDVKTNRRRRRVVTDDDNTEHRGRKYTEGNEGSGNTEETADTRERHATN